jgi:integral membrane protein
VSSLRRLRAVALLEGVSYLLLLFVAMPLKYFWEMPLAVRIVGSLHGMLFIVFLAALGVKQAMAGLNNPLLVAG